MSNQKEISEQRQKQDRVMRQTNKLQKEIQVKKGALEATAEEVSVGCNTYILYIIYIVPVYVY